MRNAKINMKEIICKQINTDWNYMAKRKAEKAGNGHSTLITAVIEGSKTLLLGVKVSCGAEDYLKIIDSEMMTGDLFGRGNNRDASEKLMMRRFLK